jgi:hypothetical protein
MFERWASAVASRILLVINFAFWSGELFPSGPSVR